LAKYTYGLLPLEQHHKIEKKQKTKKKHLIIFINNNVNINTHGDLLFCFGFFFIIKITCIYYSLSRPPLATNAALERARVSFLLSRNAKLIDAGGSSSKRGRRRRRRRRETKGEAKEQSNSCETRRTKRTRRIHTCA
jgi:hypothetical protein